LALDEPKSTDERFDLNGLTFVIDKELYEESKPITLDYDDAQAGGWLTIKSALSDKNCSGGCSC
jgi:Fe-S cluster assembly iron-binding protein IscA